MHQAEERAVGRIASKLNRALGQRQGLRKAGECHKIVGAPRDIRGKVGAIRLPGK